MTTLDHLLTLDADLVRRQPADPLDPDVELEDVVVGTTRCELQQTTAGEVLEGRIMATGWRVFLPADVDLAGVDALRVDGELLELDGDPWHVRNPRTSSVHHVEAQVRRTR